MRFLSILMGSILVTILIFMMARFWGQSQQYTAYEHPFFSASSAPFYIARVNSLGEAASADILSPQAIFWLDVRLTRDNKIILVEEAKSEKILTKEKLGLESFRGPGVTRYTFDEVQKYIPGSTTLTEILTKYPLRRMILNIVDNVENIHQIVSESLPDPKANEQILIQSDTHVVMTSIKELRPLWLYGTSQADIMRLLSFESLFILPAAPFKGDVFITPIKILGRHVLNAAVIEEMKHRKKKIVIGPISNENDFKDAKQLSPDGYFLENPEISGRWLQM